MSIPLKVGSSSQGTNSGGVTTSITFAHTTTNNTEFLAVFISALGGPGKSITGVTYNGVSCFLAVNHTSPDNDISEVWYILAANLPAFGANNIVVTGSAVMSITASSANFTNVSQRSPFLTFNSADGKSTNPEVQVSSSVTDIVIGSGNVFTNAGESVRAADTLIESVVVPGNVGQLSFISPGLLSVNFGFDTVIDFWAISCLSLRSPSADENFQNIQKALDLALMTNDFGITATLENITLDADTSTPYINAYLLPAQPAQSGLGDTGTDRHEGVYQIDINYPIKSGTVNHHIIADALNAVFKSGADLTFNGLCVRVESIGITPKRTASGWSIMSVNVNYFVTTQRIP